MRSKAHVKLGVDINGRNIPASQQRADANTHTSAETIRKRAGLLDPTPEQAKAFWGKNEPHMLPSNDEPRATFSDRPVSGCEATAWNSASILATVSPSPPSMPVQEAASLRTLRTFMATGLRTLRVRS
jgi:hypothetical protein